MSKLKPTQIKPAAAGPKGGKPPVGSRQNDRVCSTPGCGIRADTRGICYRCYGYWYRQQKRKAEARSA